MKVLQQIYIPQESVNDQYVTVMRLFFAAGDAVKKGDVVMELETSKATLTLQADTDGFVRYHCAEGDEVAIGFLAAEIVAEYVQEGVKELQQVETNAKVLIQPEETLFSKQAEAYIQQHHIPLALFKGLDFVTLETVQQLTGSKPIKEKIKTPVAAETKKVNIPEGARVRNVSRSKKHEIEYLTSVQSAGLLSTVHVEVKTSGILPQLNKTLQYLKNSLLPLIVYETSRLLDQYPDLNAFYNEGQIIQYQQIDVGFAMDVDDGLKTLRIGQAHHLTLQQTEQKIWELSQKYIDKKLEVQDMTGITFTITDLSAEGVYSFTPLVNYNNAAILGVSTMSQETGRQIFSLSFDHRVTEGKTAARFLNDLRERLESYSSGKEQNKSQICFRCMKRLEQDFSSIGFVKTLRPSGEEVYVCLSCLKGL